MGGWYGSDDKFTEVSQYMLTDIFSERYISREIWINFTEDESKLLVQCFRIVAEQVIPYWVNGKESNNAKEQWKSLHDRLSMVLGLNELAPKYFSYQTTYMGKPFTQTGTYTYDRICKSFVCARYTVGISPDRFMKERISFIELAFRIREEELTTFNQELAKKIARATIDGNRNQLRLADELRSSIDSMNTTFKECVYELNERLKRAGTPLNYHNGFIQIVTYPLVEKHIERPFWEIVANPLWKNVDVDMKEALDRRDTNVRDAAFYAALAL
jgi:hypothetical protein